MNINWDSVVEKAIATVIASGILGLFAFGWKQFNNILKAIVKWTISNWQLIIGIILQIIVAYEIFLETNTLLTITLALALALASILLTRYRLNISIHNPDLPNNDLYSPEVHFITSGNTNSCLRRSSEFLKNQKSTIAIWVWFYPDNNMGMRTLGHHQYLIAHDTNKGNPLYRLGAKNDYQNAFGFLLNKSNNWQFWLTDENGQKYTVPSFPDSTSVIPTGWNHFAIRWDHTKPLLEILVNEKMMISTTDYLNHWPNRYDQNIFIGTWQGLHKSHFINTYVTEPLIINDFIQDSGIKLLMNSCPVNPPQ